MSIQRSAPSAAHCDAYGSTGTSPPLDEDTRDELVEAASAAYEDGWQRWELVEPVFAAARTRGVALTPAEARSIVREALSR